MTNERRLGDFVDFENPRQISLSLKRKAKACRGAAIWISGNVERTDESLVLKNILVSATGYLNLGADNIRGHISVIAIVTRSLYELNLQTRDVIGSSAGLARWNGEAATDKMQVLEGIMELETVGDSGYQRHILSTEISRLRYLRRKYDLPEKTPRSAGALENSVGLKREHRALFKLFSKLIHPSSYLVNDPKNAASPEVRDILIMHAQLYAGDTFERICSRIGVANSIRRKFV